MVEYLEVELETGQKYFIRPEFDGSDQRFMRTVRNLDKMHRDGRPITVVSPVRRLNIEEIEEYRVFFCSYAKKVKRNMIYFQGPVSVIKIDN